MKLRNNGNPFTLYRAHGDRSVLGLFELESDAKLAAQGKGEWGSNGSVYAETYIHAPDGNIYHLGGKLDQTIVPAGFTDKVNSAKAKLSQAELDALIFTLRG
jgi:hypothetical protein